MREIKEKIKSGDDSVFLHKDWNKSNKAIDTTDPRNFGSAEEFVNKMSGSATQYGDYNPNIRLAGNLSGHENITRLGINPNKEITIYRGIDDVSGKVKRKINDGDFVTTDFDSALSYTGNPKDVVSMKVKAKDLWVSEPSDFKAEPFYTGAEYVYTTKSNQVSKIPSESQLTDIWNKAKGDNPLIQEAKKGVYDEVIKPSGNSYNIKNDFEFYDSLPKEPKGSRKTVKIIGANPSPNDMIIRTQKGEAFQRNSQTMYKKVPVKVLTEYVAGGLNLRVYLLRPLQFKENTQKLRDWKKNNYMSAGNSKPNYTGSDGNY